MTRPHLLRVDLPPETFAPLVSAAREAGLRIGWLDLTPATPPAALEDAASLGVLRAVAVGEERAVSVKPLSGPPVLADLLREHFLGCKVVLVRGVVEAPLLTPAGPPDRADGWLLRFADGSQSHRDTPALVGRLRSPRPLAERATA